MSDDTDRRTRIGVISLGCAKNLVDTEVMLGHLDRSGCELVTEPAEADVILVNTCGFIEAARTESVETIIEAAGLKKHGKLKRLVVAGCMVQRYRDELQRELPEVDAFVGLDELHGIIEAAGLRKTRPIEIGRSGLASDLPLVATASKGNQAIAPTAVAAWGAATYLYDDTTPRRTSTPPWTAYVKIAEGCDHTCSFCAIPSFRGKFRSRERDSIVREARALAAAGVREINLIAQDSSHYGRDRGERDGLATLLRELDTIEALRWIRVHYLYPNTITDALIEAMADLSRVVPYVDLPLQHAHPGTLRRMRRGGSAESHLALLERFRRVIPGVALRSTFIVGFPGETEDEFAALLGFLDQARFDHVGAFTYSHEQSTTALSYDDDVTEEMKDSRRDRLMSRHQTIAFERLSDIVGSELAVLVEGPHPETDHLLVGRTARQAPDVDGQVLLNDGIDGTAPRPGEFVRVAITETAGYDLVGRVLGPV